MNRYNLWDATKLSLLIQQESIQEWSGGSIAKVSKKSGHKPQFMLSTPCFK